MSDVVVGSKSWTRSPCETIEICHIWIIDRFSLRTENVLRSSTFSSPNDQLSGNKRKEWRLNLYPYGHNDENKDYLAVFVELLTTQESVPVNISITIQEDQSGSCFIIGRANKTLCNKVNNWGFIRLYKRETLLNKLSAHDALKITCELRYVSKNSENLSGTPRNELKDPGCDLSSNLGSLMDNDGLGGLFSDVTLCVLGEDNKTIEFPAHRNILAVRSPYFAAIFKNEIKEKREDRIIIDDINPEIFNDVVTFIYTGSDPKNMTESLAKDLLVASTRFKLDRLKTIVQIYLVSQLNMENVCEFLVLADTYSADTLKAGATEYIVENLRQVIKTEGWAMLILGYPHLTKDF